MAFDAYLFIDTVKGESKSEFKTKPTGMTEQPIELYSFSFGATQTLNIGSQSTGAGAGRVSFSAFSIMKKTDNTSPVLFTACCAGTAYKKAILVLRKSGGAPGAEQQVFLQYDFSLFAVESVQWSGSSGGDDVPMESVSFEYGALKIQNYTQDPTGKLAKGNVAVWSRIKNNASELIT